MSLENFLSKVRGGGTHQFTGAFSLDLESARSKWAEHGLPEFDSAVLSLVGVAHKLARQGDIDIALKRSEVRIRFRCNNGPPFSSTKALQSALVDPFSKNQEAPGALARGILAALITGARKVEVALSSGGISSTWSVYLGSPVEQKGNLDTQGTEPVEVEFRIVRSSSWPLLTFVRHRQQALDFLQERCSFSVSDLRISGQTLEPPSAVVLNSHLREFHGSQFNAAIGAMQMMRSKVPASLLIFQVAESGGPGVRVDLPPREAYTERGEGYVWKQALEPGNSFRPDGDEIPAWILSFQDESGVPLSWDVVSVQKSFHWVAALNIHGPGSSEQVRVRIVRDGITLLDDSEDKEGGLEELIGCSLLCADRELDTDLSGLRIVKNAKYYSRLTSFERAVEQGHRMFRASEGAMELC